MFISRMKFPSSLSAQIFIMKAHRYIFHRILPDVACTHQDGRIVYQMFKTSSALILFSVLWHAVNPAQAYYSMVIFYETIVFIYLVQTLCLFIYVAMETSNHVIL